MIPDDGGIFFCRIEIIRFPDRQGGSEGRPWEFNPFGTCRGGSYDEEYGEGAEKSHGTNMPQVRLGIP
jgi:hypothetical protein